MRRLENKFVLSAILLCAGAFLLAACARDWRLIERRKSELQLATFSVDVTPPVGHPLCGGWIRPLESVDDPELAKGVILRDAGGTYVLCAIDWCELRNETYDRFREKIAEAAGTDVSRVAVQTVHQHDAPIADGGTQKILDQYPGAPPHADPKFLEAASDSVAAAVKSAGERWQRVTHVSTTKAKVEKVASNRRVPGPDGSILVRYSSTKDPALQAAPEGVIDPWLRTISFYDGGQAVARLHYYATHPQSYYGQGRATWDVPGIAREKLQRNTGVFQVYFTGAAGDITMGKYNDGEPARRVELAGRVHDAMMRSINEADQHRVPVQPITWKTRGVQFALRNEPEFSEEAFIARVANAETPVQPRINAALGISWTRRVNEGREIEISLMEMGDIRILHLPGEPFIEFQLYAQKLRPDCFVAVAGYGDAGMGYVCRDVAYREGGYEPTASLIGPPSESILKNAIAELME